MPIGFEADGLIKKLVTAVHAHVLLVVHDASDLDADLDIPLREMLEEFGYTVDVADPADVAGNLELNYTAITVSASCVAGDATNLANLRIADCPVVCHSAAIAVSAVFYMGTGAGSEVSQTQIEIKDNTPQWFLVHALGDLTVTAAATIYTIATAGANASTYAEEATGTGSDITFLYLLQGLDDDGAPAYAPGFDRGFCGVADMGKINAAFKTVLEHFYEHLLHEQRFSDEVVVVPKRAYQEQIPDDDVSDTATTTESECILLTKGPKHNRRFCLRNLRIKAQADPAANTMTVKLYEYFEGALVNVDSFDITTSNWDTYHSLMDMFGIPEVHSDAFKVSCVMDAGTLAVKATYCFSEAKK